MGYAIAQFFLEQNAFVKLISGPVNISLSNPNLNIINVNTAQEMYDQCIDNSHNYDIIIMAAAVADYTPIEIKKEKIKKENQDNINITLKPTKDILKALGSTKKEHQILVGFALETDNEKENAIKKLINKNLDFIVLNSMKDGGAGFGYDTNKITIIDKNYSELKFNLMSKKDVAKEIGHFIKSKYFI